MIIKEGVKVVREYPDWITDRNPTKEELVWDEKNRKYIGRFLVSIQGKDKIGGVRVAYFHIGPNIRNPEKATRKTRKWDKGIWLSQSFMSFATFVLSVDGWMPLPKPVKE